MSNLRTTILAALTLIGAPTLTMAETPLLGLDRIEKASPWKAVGRLELRDTGYCTATLIAPDLVLSAAHCTYDADGKPLLPAALTFRAGFREGRVEAERKVIQIARPDAFVYDSDETLVRIANDVALLRLSTPVPTHVIAPFVVAPRAINGGDVSVVSYGRGRETLPSLQRTCKVLQQYRGVLAMDCDTTFGSSGAPVFRRDGERVRIVSVISGYINISGVRHTTGMILPAMVAALKAKLVAEGAVPPPRINRIGVGQRATGGAKFVRPSGS